MDWVEVIGYVASALIVASLTRTRILHLRILSLVGSVTFIVYGVLISSIPIVLTNVVILGINVFHLWKIYTLHEDFSLLQVRPDSAYLRRFLDFHAEEIGATQPDFTGVREGDTVLLVLRDLVPAAVVVGATEGTHFRVFLDFAIPAYRDFKMGRWLYGRRRDVFADLGVERVVATGPTAAQRDYLRRSGFEQESEGKWVRPLG